MPTTNEKFSWPDEKLVDDAFQCLKILNPALTTADLVDTKVSRLRHAQTICPPGFASSSPAIQTPIQGLQVADTSSYYPEDRSIAESVRLGRMMARICDDSPGESPASSEKPVTAKQ
jgi:protoporphyrinogen oxidase